MTETTEASEPLACPICGALVGDAAKHEAWHRDLPGSVAKHLGRLGV